MKTYLPLLTFVLFIIFNTLLGVCTADLYKWKDANGVLHFSDVQPGQNKDFERVEENYNSNPKRSHHITQRDDANIHILEHFSIKNAKAVRNYHNKNSDECSSIEFRSIIKNNSDIDRTIYISFHIKNNEGIVLEKDNGFKDIEANTGDIEPRVLVSFYGGSQHYSCKDVASIDFYYYERETEKKKITLPIVDANHM